MTRSLRRAHRRAAAGLALALPPLLALALAARSPQASAPESRAALGLALGRAADGTRTIELDTRGAPVIPDGLAYFSAHSPAADTVPSDAILLGEIPSDAVRSYPLPGRAAGQVIVFSLGWDRVVASAPVAAERAP
jgi:hypothetical protein